MNMSYNSPRNALSKSEAGIAGISAELFSKADADMNGTLSKDEYAALVTNGK